MSWKLSFLAALKSAAYVLVGGVIAALASPEFAATLQGIADALASAVPVVGGLLGGAVSAALLAGAAALVAFLNNARKHWNDPPAPAKH